MEPAATFEADQRVYLLWYQWQAQTIAGIGAETKWKGHCKHPKGNRIMLSSFKGTIKALRLVSPLDACLLNVDQESVPPRAPFEALRDQ